jgi:hypothetical protein
VTVDGTHAYFDPIDESLLHADKAYKAAFAPVMSKDGQRAFGRVRFKDGTLGFIDIDSGERVSPRSRKLTGIGDIVISADGARAIGLAYSKQGPVFFDLIAQKDIKVSVGLFGTCHKISMSPDGSLAFARANLSEFGVTEAFIDLNTGTPVQNPGNTQQSIEGPYFSQDGRWAIGEFSQSGLYDLKKGSLIHASNDGPVARAGPWYAPDGSRAVVGTRTNGVFQLLDLDTRTFISPPAGSTWASVCVAQGALIGISRGEDGTHHFVGLSGDVVGRIGSSRIHEEIPSWGYARAE